MPGSRAQSTVLRCRTRHDSDAAVDVSRQCLGVSLQRLDVWSRYGHAGPHLQGQHLRAMIEAARPTLTAMVPTILGDLLQADESLSARSFVFSRDCIGRICGAVIHDRGRARAVGRARDSGMGYDRNQSDVCAVASPQGPGR